MTKKVIDRQIDEIIAKIKANPNISERNDIACEEFKNLIDDLLIDMPEANEYHIGLSKLKGNPIFISDDLIYDLNPDKILKEVNDSLIYDYKNNWSNMDFINNYIKSIQTKIIKGENIEEIIIDKCTDLGIYYDDLFEMLNDNICSYLTNDITPVIYEDIPLHAIIEINSSELKLNSTIQLCMEKNTFIDLLNNKNIIYADERIIKISNIAMYSDNSTNKINKDDLLRGNKIIKSIKFYTQTELPIKVNCFQIIDNRRDA